MTANANTYQCKTCDRHIAQPDSYCADCIDDFIDRPQLIAARLLASGRSPESVIEELVESGTPESAAKSIVDGTQSAGLDGGNKAVRNVARKSAGSIIANGVVVMALGAIITSLGYLFAGGGIFLAFWGLIAYGAYMILKGLLRFLGASANSPTE